MKAFISIGQIENVPTVPTVPICFPKPPNNQQCDAFLLLAESVAFEIGTVGAKCDGLPKNEFSPTTPTSLYKPFLKGFSSTRVARAYIEKREIGNLALVGTDENVAKLVRAYLKTLPVWLKWRRAALVRSFLLRFEEFDDEAAALDLQETLTSWLETNWRKLPEYLPELPGEDIEAWLDRCYEASGFVYLAPDLSSSSRRAAA